MAFRQTSESVIKRRQEDAEKTKHLTEAYRKYTSFPKNLEQIIRDEVEARHAASKRELMRQVLETLEGGASKGAVVRTLDISRQTLDRWIKTYEEEKGKP